MSSSTCSPSVSLLDVSADAARNAIYELDMADPVVNNVRALLQTFHISLKRVDGELGQVTDILSLQIRVRQGMAAILNISDRAMKKDVLSIK
ncbi:hypothetical protein H0H92_001138 [Tricholoma furcatifolium]|nr:hypothetical protein H0H92_001138 [Tricholoma furcatifolium]